MQRLLLVVRKDGSHNAPSHGEEEEEEEEEVGSLKVRMEA
jgi:hypothetical protein